MMIEVKFLIFVVLQSFFINGVYESFRGKTLNDINKGIVHSGNILYPVKLFLSKYVSDYWMNPICNCVKCMASLWGGLSFWSTVLIVYGFHWQQIPLFFFDVFILVHLNAYFYNKL